MKMREAIILSLCLIIIIVQIMRLILDYLNYGTLEPGDVTLTALLLMFLAWVVL